MTNWLVRNGALCALLTLFLAASPAFAGEALFEPIGPPEYVDLPEHVTLAQPVRVNRRALEAPAMDIALPEGTLTAVRDRVERQRAGQLVWVGHVEGNPLDTVIVTIRGNAVSALIQNGAASYRLGVGADGRNRLFQLDLDSLPPDDAADPPPAGDDGTGSTTTSGGGTLAADGNVVQDLLVVYTQGACNYKGGCAQLEADIVTAVADINTAYGESGIAITMNLVGMAFTDYAGVDAQPALYDLQGTTDGQMDEVHPLRDSLGADIVSLVYDGQGCGIGFLNSSASYAFNVTDVPCLVGNRTMAHEIGHNQGAHHDRVTVGTTSTTTYNYGYRRCNDTSVDGTGSPHFRTIMSYSCSGSPRVGRLSNPFVSYSGVPQGVDPDVEPASGAHNARVLNERATTVAGFRATAAIEPPLAPTGLAATATGFDTIELTWTDNATTESNYVVQSSGDGGLTWSTRATLAADSTAFTDTGLAAESTYAYRVRAENSAGSSAYSNEASATTQAAPSFIDQVATADVFQNGTVSGTYAATHAPDGVAQVIEEAHSGGPKRSRRQAYAHAWTFDVAPGAGGVVATVEAWVSGSEAADFFYSVDGGATLQPMFRVSANTAGSPQSFTLPGGTSGSVRIEVRDTEQSNGEAVDSVIVDQLLITSYTDQGEPPAAPSSLVVTATTASTASLSFTDNATDEWGFEIRRATADPLGDCTAGTVVGTAGAGADAGGTVAYEDSDLAPETSYWYLVSAFNGAGDSACSNAAQAVTATAPALSLSVAPYKVKGAQTVDLSWTGGGGAASVDIVRDGAIIATVQNSSAYTDNIGVKGGGSYVYQVCEAGTATCSAEVSAIF